MSDSVLVKAVCPRVTPDGEYCLTCRNWIGGMIQGEHGIIEVQLSVSEVDRLVNERLAESHLILKPSVEEEG